MTEQSVYSCSGSWSYNLSMGWCLTQSASLYCILPLIHLGWPCLEEIKYTHTSCLLCAFSCTVVVSGTRITSFPRGSAHDLRDWDSRNEHLFCESLFYRKNMHQKEASLKTTLSTFCNPAVNIFLSQFDKMYFAA